MRKLGWGTKRIAAELGCSRNTVKTLVGARWVAALRPAAAPASARRELLIEATALDALPRMLTRLKLTAIRDQLDGLLDEASGRDLTLREALALFCERGIARKDERRISMHLSIAKFPFVRELSAFDFTAQPSLDPKQLRELATGRFRRQRRCGPAPRPTRASGKRTSRWHSGAK